MKHSMKVKAVLKAKMCKTEGENVYLCTFRGKTLHVAGNEVKFECAENVSPADITKHFFKESELKHLEIVITKQYE